MMTCLDCREAARISIGEIGDKALDTANSFCAPDKERVGQCPPNRIAHDSRLTVTVRVTQRDPFHTSRLEFLWPASANQKKSN
jgi:streptomycin 6-kinase